MQGAKPALSPAPWSSHSQSLSAGGHRDPPAAEGVLKMLVLEVGTVKWQGQGG